MSSGFHFLFASRDPKACAEFAFSLESQRHHALDQCTGLGSTLETTDQQVLGSQKTQGQGKGQRQSGKGKGQGTEGQRPDVEAKDKGEKDEMERRGAVGLPTTTTRPEEKDLGGEEREAGAGGARKEVTRHGQKTAGGSQAGCSSAEGAGQLHEHQINVTEAIAKGNELCRGDPFSSAGGGSRAKTQECQQQQLRGQRKADEAEDEQDGEGRTGRQEVDALQSEEIAAFNEGHEQVAELLLSQTSTSKQQVGAAINGHEQLANSLSSTCSFAALNGQEQVAEELLSPGEQFAALNGQEQVAEELLSHKDEQLAAFNGHEQLATQEVLSGVSCAKLAGRDVKDVSSFLPAHPGLQAAGGESVIGLNINNKLAAVGGGTGQPALPVASSALNEPSGVEQATGDRAAEGSEDDEEEDAEEEESGSGDDLNDFFEAAEGDADETAEIDAADVACGVRHPPAHFKISTPPTVPAWPLEADKAEEEVPWHEKPLWEKVLSKRQKKKQLKRMSLAEFQTQEAERKAGGKQKESKALGKGGGKHEEAEPLARSGIGLRQRLLKAWEHELAQNPEQLTDEIANELKKLRAEIEMVPE